MSEIASNLDAARERLKSEAEPSPYLTIPEVMKLARCGETSVRSAVRSGALPAFRTAERILVRHSDAVAWIESRPARSEHPRREPGRRRPAAGNVQALREMDPGLRRGA